MRHACEGSLLADQNARGVGWSGLASTSSLGMVSETKGTRVHPTTLPRVARPDFVAPRPRIYMDEVAREGSIRVRALYAFKTTPYKYQDALLVLVQEFAKAHRLHAGR